MRRPVLLIILVATFTFAKAFQSDQQYDSVMNIMKDKSIPLLSRYYMTGNIGAFTFEQQSEILKTLIPEAKTYEDKAVVTRLYAVLANTLIMIEDMKGAEMYLDSAFQYKGQFESNSIAGLMHYVKGNYYHNLSDINLAHENYYESVKFLQQLPTRPGLLTTIYYDLSRIYALWQDEERLKEIVGEMKEIPYYSTEQYLMNYSVIADLFIVQHEKSNEPSLLDSIIKYNELAVDVYNSNIDKETADVGHQLSQNFITLTRAYFKKGDLENARLNLEQAGKFVNERRWLTVMELNIVRGELYTRSGEFDEAEQAFNKAIELLNVLKQEQQIDYYYYYILIYENLGHIYEERKMYDKALIYEKKLLEYRKRFFSKENATLINDLRAQYNLDQQERIVNQLTLLSERRKNIIVLAAVILVLFLALIVQVIIRSRIKRRANENMLKIEQMKRKESELEVELYKSRQEEKDREFEVMQTEMQQRRMQSYIEGLEAARKKLSKELHDNISNELLALKMRVMQSEEPENIIGQIGKIHTEVRAVSHELMPPAFQHARFTEVLYDYVYQRKQLSETQITLNLDPEDETWDQLTEEINLSLYRIIQEAVGNALKHADATEISISLSRKMDKINLMIRDNGKGFDADGSHKGIGLRLIRERAENLHGQAQIYGAPGKGTTVEITVNTDMIKS